MSDLSVRRIHLAKKACILISLPAMLCVLLASPAVAVQWDKRTVVTFSAPVEIPGTVLRAGTYVFKLEQTESNRDVVAVFDQNETHVYATVLAVPAYRLQPTGKTVIQFEERVAGAPKAVKTWFYPGQYYGEHFLYPHVR